MKYPKKVNMDLSKSLHNSIQVKQSDNSRYLLFRILDNGVPFDLSNKTVRVFGKKADGKEIYNDLPITNATKGECELRLTSGALSAPGILQLEIEVKENEDVLSTFLLDVDVKRSLRSNSSIESSNEYTIIEKIIETMKDWIKKVDEAIKKIPGKEELIPSIGENGNWFIGGKDTGVGTSGVIFEIKRNTDLDSVKKPGYYKCTDPDIVSTLENCPTDNSFTLFVEDLKQTLSEAVASAGAKTWSRSYRNGMWGFWDKNFSEYSRPTSDEIIVSAESQFVSNVEKTSWNNKISKDDYEVGSNGICKTLDSRNDIRLINKSGKYSGINVTGNPTGTDAFYFYDVECMSSDVRIVTAKTADSPLRIFVGSYISEWLGWKEVFNVDRKPTPADIGASPSGHNHDDRYFTEAEINEKLKTKVSVESGKGLSTNDYTTAEKNKLLGIAAGANAYAHPSSHPATMITEDSVHRFVTDSEKSNWNGKASTSVASTTSNGLMSKDMVSKLNGIAAGANAYKHPNSHPATMIAEDATHRFVTDAEKASWNSKPAENHNHDNVYSKIGHTHDYLPTNGKAADSSKLNNKGESSAGTANTIVSRDSAGDVVARLLRTTYNDQSTMSGAIAFRTNNSTDNYTRYCNNPSAVRAWLGAITKAQILDMFFPIGTIHFTVQNVNPGTTMGGTWVAWGSGRVPVGVNTGDSSFSTPEKTGGSKTMIHNHGSGTLGANIGAFDTDITSIGYQAGPKRTNDSAFTYGFKGLPIISGSVSNSRIAHNTPVYGATDDSSSSTSNNLQPYITCYMWKRTA
ncbi:MAG: phage baseplate protein [Clostridium paraputrificum]